MLHVAMLSSSIIGSKVNQDELDRKGKVLKYSAPLYDVLHNTLPDMSRFDQIIDYLPIVLGIIILHLAIIKHPKFNMYRLIQLVSFMLILRIMTSAFTVLPSPICTNSKTACAIGGCHDCIFSGHTAMTLIFAYTIQHCYPELKIPLLIYTLFGSLLIIGTRNHYTVDVIVAWIVVYALIKSGSCDYLSD